MEPSLKGWASGKSDAIDKVKKGFQNFVGGIEPMLLHYCIRKYLVSSPDDYYITDFSKGAMETDKANVNRTERYKRWIDLLKEEVKLLSRQDQDTQIIAVGKAVEDDLRKYGFDKPTKKIIHYSRQAAIWREEFAKSQPAEFDQFQNTVNIEDRRLIAHTVIDESGVPPIFADKAKAQFDKLDLDRAPTNYYRKFLFSYKNQFRELGT